VSAGYYYSEGAVLKVSDGGSVRGRLEYNIANGLTSGINIVYSPESHQSFPAENFVLSADLKYRFGANGYGSPSIRNQQPVVMPVIQALSATPANRDVRLHDGCLADNFDPSNNKWRGEFWSWNCSDGISEEWGAVTGQTADGKKWRSYGKGKLIPDPIRSRNGLIWYKHSGGVCEKPGVSCS
jgi:hypothetical protein